MCKITICLYVSWMVPMTDLDWMEAVHLQVVINTLLY